MNQTECSKTICEPERMTQVLEELAQLKYVVSDIRTVVEELEGNLSPVLLQRCEAPIGNKPTQDPCNLVPLASEMREIFFSSKRCKDMVVDIIQRLEL